jgi:hypothetical protein
MKDNLHAVCRTLYRFQAIACFSYICFGSIITLAISGGMSVVKNQAYAGVRQVHVKNE